VSFIFEHSLAAACVAARCARYGFNRFRREPSEMRFLRHKLSIMTMLAKIFSQQLLLGNRKVKGVWQATRPKGCGSEKLRGRNNSALLLLAP